MFRQLNPSLTGGTPLRVGAVIAIDVNKVAGMRHPIDVLAVALLLVLCAGQVLGFGHPTGEVGGYYRVIAGWFEQCLESVGAHDVEADRIAGGQAFKEAKHLLAGIGQAWARHEQGRHLRLAQTLSAAGATASGTLPEQCPLQT